MFIFIHIREIMIDENMITNNLGYNFYIRTHKQTIEVTSKTLMSSNRLLTKTV